MNGNGTFIRVLERYGLRHAVPVAVRERISRTKRETLARILREYGRYSITVRAALSLFRTIRVMGLPISFWQGRIVSSALAAVVVCALFAGTFIVTRPVLFHEEEIRGVVVFAMGDVNRVAGDGTSSALKVRDLLSRDDTVRTGEKSAALVQFGESVMVRLQPGSEVKVATLAGHPDLTLGISSGTLMARIEKLSGNRSFTVKSPTLVASVRGTAFSIACGNVTSIAVAEGTVAVKHLITKAEVILKAGSAADDSDGIKERPATNVETIGMRRVTAIPFMKNPPKATDAEFSALADLVKKIDSEVDAELQKLQAETIPRTLQEIRERYGRIDVVNLYSGEVVRGAILVRGSMMKLVVPGKYRFIPMNTVKNTSLE